MNITIFGATGQLGNRIVEEGLLRKQRLTVLVRNPHKLTWNDQSLQVVRGDALEKRVVAEAIMGAEVVISALGGPPKGALIKPGSQIHNATRNIVDAMSEHGVQRLLYLSAWGVGDSKDHTTAAFRYIIRPMALKAEYADKEIQERIVMESHLSWTLVRPTVLTNNKASNYRAGRQLYFPPWKNIVPPMVSRADVAQFIFNEIDKPMYSRSPVMISGA